MKTITFKANNRFDARLAQIAKRLKTTKSAVIRAAVGEYERRLEREELGHRIREASLKTRNEVRRAAADLNAANADGL